MKTPFLALAAFLAFAAAASAQTMITSVPYTITQSGKYILGTNLSNPSINQSCIIINAPNVILDLNQFFISGPANTPATTGTGISVGNYSNVTIRNGTVANNGTGIFFSGGANSINHLVEKVNITRCYFAGIFFLVGPASSGTIVRENAISQIGGSTSSGGPLNTYGILATGGIRIEDNAITDLSNSNPNAIVAGIEATNADIAVGNTIANSAGFGVRNAKCQNNLTNNCAVPFSGTTDAGGNF